MQSVIVLYHCVVIPSIEPIKINTLVSFYYTQYFLKPHIQICIIYVHD